MNDQKNIMYVGDIHGETDILDEILAPLDEKYRKTGNVTFVIQVGDFGFGFPDNGKMESWLEKRAHNLYAVPIYTCMGNHDNWEMLHSMEYSYKAGLDRNIPVNLARDGNVYYVPRGSLLWIDDVKHLFFGGAESVDRSSRVEGSTWWRQETPSYKETDKFLRRFENDQPTVIVSHDAPTRVKIYKHNHTQDRSRQDTPIALECAYKYTTNIPALHVFGHHHIKKTWDIQGTKFACCGLHGDFYTYNELMGLD